MVDQTLERCVCGWITDRGVDLNLRGHHRHHDILDNSDDIELRNSFKSYGLAFEKGYVRYVLSADGCWLALQATDVALANPSVRRGIMRLTKYIGVGQVIWTEVENVKDYVYDPERDDDEIHAIFVWPMQRRQFIAFLTEDKV